MKLASLLSIFPQITWGPAPELRNREVTAICFDSRQLQEGCVFVAIKGTKVDGHEFLATAAAKGALALIVESSEKVPADFAGAVVHVASSRLALNKLSAQYYAHPSRELFCTGVTGTNGKTTLTHMIEAIMNDSAKPTGVIGTIDHHLQTPAGLQEWKTELTTPDPLEFQKRLREFRKLGATALAMEVSNVGLLQNRSDEVAFDVAVFTNLTRDHLDIHPDMEDYFRAKRRLFLELLPASHKAQPTAVINGDDQYGKRLISELRGVTAASGKNITVWSYGRDRSADGPHELRFTVLQQGFFGTRFLLSTPLGEQEFEILMPGLHNVYNAVGAIGAAVVAGVSLKACAEALRKLSGVKGRLEAVPNRKGLFVFVDYAHTDDALATVLHYLGRIRDEAGLKSKIITVFGCGGDRDKGKRPLMMKAATAASDVVVVTSDNPRTENPDAIIQDILAGAASADVGKRVFSVVERREGIRRALELAFEGDVVLIAGKGHEDYQILGTIKHPFSDVAVVKEILT